MASDIAAPTQGYQDTLDEVLSGPAIGQITGHGTPRKRVYRWATSSYTVELAEEICERLAQGESLRAICRDEHMPSEAAVRWWVVENVNDFAAHYTKARDSGLDCMADQAVEIADGAATAADAIVARLRFDARRWYLSKLAPKRYGDRLELTGKDGGPVQIAQVDDHELARRVALLMSRTIEAKAQVIDTVGETSVDTDDNGIAPE